MAELQVLFAFIIVPTLIIILILGIGTAINFIPAFYVAKYLAVKVHVGQRTIFLLVFFTLIIVLHLNYRIPGIITDLQRPNEVYEIIEPISTYIGDTVSIELNHESIKYKPNYLESTGVKFGYGFSKAKVNTDSFISRLERRGLRIQRGQDEPVKILGSIEKTSTHNAISIRVIKNEKVVAKYSNTFRIAFAGEQSNNAFIQLLLAIMQSTPTRLAFPDFWSLILGNDPSVNTVSRFLDRVFQVYPKPESLTPSYYTVVSFEKEPNDRILSNEELRIGRDVCNAGNKRIIISRRRIRNDKKPENQKWEPAGAWIDFYENDHLKIRKYLQAPNINNYLYHHMHRVDCDSQYFNLLVSFYGLGMSEAEWLESLPKMTIKGFSSNSSPDKIKAFRDEQKRVNSTINKRYKNNLREIWLLKYKHDGELKEAINFILPDDAPGTIDTITKLNPNEWTLTGFDIESRQENGKYNRHKINDYSITIKKK